MSTEPITGLTYQEAGSLQTDALQNAEINYYGAWLNCAVKSVGTNAPPASPASGDRYIVGTAPTGAWSGMANALAVFRVAWQFYAPPADGVPIIKDIATGNDYQFIAGAWAAKTTGTGDVVGPATAVAGNVALFDGTTGKLIKDGGTLGTAAFTASTAYDVSGAATTAENNAKSYADTLVVGLLDDRGNHDASTNAFPSTGGSGAAGAILKGDLWTISVAGTLGGSAVTVGDVVRALIDSPGTVAANWVITENNIGYVPEPAQTAASQAEAEAGTVTAIRSFSPLRIFQAIAAKLALGTWISGATAKATPVDADSLAMHDSVGGTLVKVTIAALKTYFDSLYSRYRQTVTALSIATGVVNIDLGGGRNRNFTLSLTANVTSITFTNLPASGYVGEFDLLFTQDATGSRTVALPAAFKPLGVSDTAVLATASSSTLLSAKTFDQGTTWRYAMQESA